MIEILPHLPGKIVGIRASGTVTAGDYETVLIPTIEESIRKHGPVCLLYVMDCSIKDFSLGAMWDDTKLGYQHLQDFERIAIVTDDHLVRGMLHALQFAMPKFLRVFPADEEDAAIEWLSS